jgi:hypothetical protein
LYLKVHERRSGNRSALKGKKTLEAKKLKKVSELATAKGFAKGLKP